MGKITVLAKSEEAFRDRQEAGRFLGRALGRVRGKDVVVLGIPRGGLVVAREAASILGADLDMILSRKLGSPRNPELAIGAISETGRVFLDETIVAHTGAGEAYIKEEAKRQSAEIGRRSGIFRKVLPKVPLSGKTAIIVDDGLATGATMQAALFTARQEKPSKLIAAVPVASDEALDRIAGYCDEVICLRLPSFFGAVGSFYSSFGQTTDEEVVKILEEESARRK
ncbi:MAG: phosphoribosyltransferase family protein [Candidatus Omnitrophica bacterium]|nr:phosphoribosyltransferase family protein [Candidatus Omnitrophota bacterium]